MNYETIMTHTPIVEYDHLLSFTDVHEIIRCPELIPAYKSFKQRYTAIFNEILIMSSIDFILTGKKFDVKMMFCSEPIEFVKLFSLDLKRADWTCEIILENCNNLQTLVIDTHMLFTQPEKIF